MPHFTGAGPAPVLRLRSAPGHRTGHSILQAGSSARTAGLRWRPLAPAAAQG